MRRHLLIILGLFLTIRPAAQMPPLPDELKPFILPGLEVLDFATGDLNSDERPDAILILKNPGEDSALDEPMPRPLLILVRQPGGKLKQVVRNDGAVMGRHEGGVFGDPYQGLDIIQTGFALYFYGGSAWRWAYEYRFGWKPGKQSWYLVSESQSSFNSGDPTMTIREVIIKETELGEVPVSRFNPDLFYRSGQWKVKTAKTYFYDHPQLDSRPRKGYLVKGNIVNGTRQLKNFIEVSFENSRGEITEWFILRRDLLQLK